MIMKQESHRSSEGINRHSFGHDLNKMLDHLRCEKKLRLPPSITLPNLKQPVRQRKAKQSDLNQVWRYGIEIKKIKDHDEITQTLENICLWIKEQR
nr:hypothetical protein [Endozoicomonas sp.]